MPSKAQIGIISIPVKAGLKLGEGIVQCPILSVESGTQMVHNYIRSHAVKLVRLLLIEDDSFGMPREGLDMNHRNMNRGSFGATLSVVALLASSCGFFERPSANSKKTNDKQTASEQDAETASNSVTTGGTVPTDIFVHAVEDAVEGASCRIAGGQTFNMDGARYAAFEKGALCVVKLRTLNLAGENPRFAFAAQNGQIIPMTQVSAKVIDAEHAEIELSTEQIDTMSNLDLFFEGDDWGAPIRNRTSLKPLDFSYFGTAKISVPDSLKSQWQDKAGKTVLESVPMRKDDATGALTFRRNEPIPVIVDLNLKRALPLGAAKVWIELDQTFAGSECLFGDLHSKSTATTNFYDWQRADELRQTLTAWTHSGSENTFALDSKPSCEALKTFAGQLTGRVLFDAGIGRAIVSPFKLNIVAEQSAADFKLNAGQPQQRDTIEIANNANIPLVGLTATLRFACKSGEELIVTTDAPVQAKANGSNELTYEMLRQNQAMSIRPRTSLEAAAKVRLDAAACAKSGATLSGLTVQETGRMGWPKQSTELAVPQFEISATSSTQKALR